jgi:hypothetical protein
VYLKVNDIKAQIKEIDIISCGSSEAYEELANELRMVIGKEGKMNRCNHNIPLEQQAWQLVLQSFLNTQKA